MNLVNREGLALHPVRQKHKDISQINESHDILQFHFKVNYLCRSSQKNWKKRIFCTHRYPSDLIWCESVLRHMSSWALWSHPGGLESSHSNIHMMWEMKTSAVARYNQYTVCPGWVKVTLCLTNSGKQLRSHNIFQNIMLWSRRSHYSLTEVKCVPVHLGVIHGHLLLFLPFKWFHLRNLVAIRIIMWMS